MPARRKITVIGGNGFNGATTSLLALLANLGDVVMLDLPQFGDPVRGKALDMLQATAILGRDVNVIGTDDYKDTADSDVVILAAGAPRKPGMSREDLLQINASLIKNSTMNALNHSPNAYLLVLPNPADAMTYIALKTSGLPRHRIIGQSGVLDTARYRTFIAQSLGVSASDVHGLVLGGHGDEMVPLTRYTSVGGIPVEQIMPAHTLSAIVERTKKGGGEIVNLLGNGSAYFAPSAALAEMADAIMNDRKRVLPGIVYLEGEYGYSDLCFGVPCVLGGQGVERVIEVQLTPQERDELALSAAKVKAQVQQIHALGLL